MTCTNCKKTLKLRTELHDEYERLFFFFKLPIRISKHYCQECNEEYVVKESTLLIIILLMLPTMWTVVQWRNNSFTSIESQIMWIYLSVFSFILACIYEWKTKRTSYITRSESENCRVKPLDTFISILIVLDLVLSGILFYAIIF